MNMNRRSLLKKISLVSVGTVIPRSIFAGSIFADSILDACVENTSAKIGPCIVFVGLWAFGVSDSSVTALTPCPSRLSHKILASAWPSGNDTELNGSEFSGKRFSIGISNENSSSSSAELIRNAHDGKLSIVLPGKKPYPNDHSLRTFSIDDQADYVSINLPLPKLIVPLMYVKIDGNHLLLDGPDKYLLRGTNNVLLKGFPTVQVFVYSGKVATLSQVDAHPGPVVAGIPNQNLHVRTVPPPGGGGQHLRDAYDALTKLFLKDELNGSAPQPAQTLNLQVDPTAFSKPVCGKLPPGVKSDEVKPAVHEEGFPDANCALGAGFILGAI